MEKLTDTQEQNLLEFLDGKLEGSALLQLKNTLAGSPAMQQRLEELRRVHEALKSNKLLTPSVSFVERVMRNLSMRPLAPSPKNGLMLVLGVMVASGLLVVMLSAGFFDQTGGLISFDQFALVKKYVTPSIPALPINGKLILKVLIGINLTLAFIVLDRTVLRPFFQRRGNHSF